MKYAADIRRDELVPDRRNAVLLEDNFIYLFILFLFFFFTLSVTFVTVDKICRFFRSYETKMASEDLIADVGPLGFFHLGLRCRDLPSLTSSCQFLCHAVGVRIVLLRTVRVFTVLPFTYTSIVLISSVHCGCVRMYLWEFIGLVKCVLLCEFTVFV